MVLPEQEFGDQIQFVRFLPELQKRGGRITLFAKSPLISLFEANLPYVEVRSASGTVQLGRPDYWTTLVDMAGPLDVTLDSLSCPPYLQTDRRGPELPKGFNVGLARAETRGTRTMSDGRWRRKRLPGCAPVCLVMSSVWIRQKVVRAISPKVPRSFKGSTSSSPWTHRSLILPALSASRCCCWCQALQRTGAGCANETIPLGIRPIGCIAARSMEAGPRRSTVCRPMLTIWLPANADREPCEGNANLPQRIDAAEAHGREMIASAEAGSALPS